jgi:hypothetical protein
MSNTARIVPVFRRLALLAGENATNVQHHVLLAYIRGDLVEVRRVLVEHFKLPHPVANSIALEPSLTGALDVLVQWLDEIGAPHAPPTAP